MTREAALNDLLASLFSADELRRHLVLEREGTDIDRSLPENGTRADFVFAAVEVLQRRGFLDRDFFDNLRAARPNRESEIQKVRNQWLHNARLDRGELWANSRYELVSSCGQGGFGLVWKALDNQTREFVALKILLEHHANDRIIRQRFYRGAAALAKLDHPSIVRVRSGVEQEGLRFFYVMDFIDGTRLDTMIAHNHHAHLLEYVLQIGDAIGHLHVRGLLHRDIKPSNILVTVKRHAWLIDFDFVTGDNFAPMTTRALGTALYAPPEAFTSDIKTPAYDVFSLARTVECVIRGREPNVIELESRDSLAMLDTPEPVKAVLRAALKRDPSRRTGSVQRLCQDLRRAFAHAAMLDVRLADQPASEVDMREVVEMPGGEEAARQAPASDQAQGQAREEAGRTARNSEAQTEILAKAVVAQTQAVEFLRAISKQAERSEDAVVAARAKDLADRSTQANPDGEVVEVQARDLQWRAQELADVGLQEEEQPSHTKREYELSEAQAQRKTEGQARGAGEHEQRPIVEEKASRFGTQVVALPQHASDGKAEFSARPQGHRPTRSARRRERALASLWIALTVLVGPTANLPSPPSEDMQGPQRGADPTPIAAANESPVPVDDRTLKAESETQVGRLSTGPGPQEKEYSPPIFGSQPSTERMISETPKIKPLAPTRPYSAPDPRAQLPEPRGQTMQPPTVDPETKPTNPPPPPETRPPPEAAKLTPPTPKKRSTLPILSKRIIARIARGCENPGEPDTAEISCDLEVDVEIFCDDQGVIIDAKPLRRYLTDPIGDCIKSSLLSSSGRYSTEIPSGTVIIFTCD